MSTDPRLQPSTDSAVRFRDSQIELAHGAGGRASRRLVEGLFVPLFGPGNVQLGDSAIVELNGVKTVLSTDAFVVRPLQFPGGSIGSLAVHGTANDIAVAGGEPVAMLATFVLEAGLPGSVLEREARAMAGAAQSVGIRIVGGDTKVVEHGKADGMYVTTTGIGVLDPRVQCCSTSVRPGDQVILTGPIGDHGTTVLLARGDIELDVRIESDSRPLRPFVKSMIEVAAPGLRWMRDPTRGGVATALNELARDTGLNVTVFEDRVPVRDAVRGACELLGLDPLHIANEGQVLAIVAADYADEAVEALRRCDGGKLAAIIGEIREGPAATVLGASSYGSTRVIDMLVGDPLPRIC